MELAQYYYDPYNKERSAVTICDANITEYLSRKHSVLHVCFLKNLRRVPIIGFVSYNYDDVWEIDFGQLKNFYSPINFFGKATDAKWLGKDIAPGDVIQIEFKICADVLYFRLGKDRKHWTCPLRTRFDPSIKVSLVVETPKKNFVVLRDDLYLDYVLNGNPRTFRTCTSCYEDDDKNRIVVAECGHYMCSNCWKKWVRSKPMSNCWVCSKAIERHVYARFRDSPCPVDHCRSGDTPRDYVLVPCGCVTRCVMKSSDGTKAICPYEVCGRSVEAQWPLYGH
ncbi:hypothetical protein V3C99_016802 [Haemonchus contortus]|uniref:RING-type domain-containing protein n=1 Tax=Haemonchus contortus TaxID=6289 RepID=A0A7I4YXR6_HAECO